MSSDRACNEIPPGSNRAPVVLGAILINPPLGNGGATRRHLNALRQVLRCDLVHIANILSVATSSTDDIRKAAVDIGLWHQTRPEVSELIQSADHILLGWGLGGITGVAREHFDAQVHWAEQELGRRKEGVPVWTVGDRPRHPSRWHQYVSDKHGHAFVGDFQERLRHVLVDHSIGASDGRLRLGT